MVIAECSNVTGSRTQDDQCRCHLKVLNLKNTAININNPLFIDQKLQRRLKVQTDIETDNIKIQYVPNRSIKGYGMLCNLPFIIQPSDTGCFMRGSKMEYTSMLHLTEYQLFFIFQLYSFHRF